MVFEEMIQLRKRFGLSQSEAARVLGVTNTLLISQWETGFRSPTELTRRFIRLLVDLPKSEAETLLKKLGSYK